MKKAEPVIYCDAKGQEHEALVFAVNPLNEGYLSLVYIDLSRPENDNVVKLHDVRHMDTVSEANPDLPTYHLNCWKNIFEHSKALPQDHPAYDHPHRKNVDQDGKVIPVDRPHYDADVERHQAGRRPTIAELEEILKEDPAATKVTINPDGSVTTVSLASSTTPAPATTIPGVDGLPTDADLDAVAEENVAGDATNVSDGTGETGPEAPQASAPDATDEAPDSN